MLTKAQRQQAYDYARINYATAQVEIDADVPRDTGFDETSSGVWVHAWIKVPKEHIDGYEVTPPAPAATVTVLSKGPAAAWPFPTVMSHPHLNNDSDS